MHDLHTPNICNPHVFEIFADLDSFDAIISVETKNDLSSAISITQKTFDDWNEGNPSVPLLEAIEDALVDANIKYRVFLSDS